MILWQFSLVLFVALKWMKSHGNTSRTLDHDQGGTWKGQKHQVVGLLQIWGKEIIVKISVHTLFGSPKEHSRNDRAINTHLHPKPLVCLVPHHARLLKDTGDR